MFGLSILMCVSEKLFSWPNMLKYKPKWLKENNYNSCAAGKQKWRGVTSTIGLMRLRCGMAF